MIFYYFRDPIVHDPPDKLPYRLNQAYPLHICAVRFGDGHYRSPCHLYRDRSFDENNVSIPTFGIKYANGKLRYETTFIGSVAPAASDIVIDFHIYVLESGTLKSIYTSSSAYDNHPDTLFKSIDSSNRTVVTDQGGNLWRGEVLTDSAKMQAIPKSKFVVTAILYDKRGPSPPVPPAVGKLTEGGILKRPEGNLNFKIKE